MISYFPEDVFEKLEFDRVLELVQQSLLSEASYSILDGMSVSTDVDIIERWLDEVDQYKKAVEDGNDLPMNGFESLDEDIPLLRKEGYVLSVEAIKRIYGIVYLAKAILEYRNNPTHRKMYPILTEIMDIIVIDVNLLKEIDRVLDETGEVRPDASPELMRIHKEIRSKEREIDNLFSNTLKRYANEGWLTDTAESYRNGRRVLTVAAENKRRIDGVIHDESATGKTVFLEPAEVMQLNNTIFNLHTERKKEVYKVLKELCNHIRPYASDLTVLEDVLIRLDIIRAKTRVAISMEANRPTVVNRPHLGLKKAYNPVLLLKNNALNKATVPFDLDLHKPNRIIVISGPNAGGKSVTMKSVGCLQLMIQFGMLIPADANSVLGVFKRIYTDIGDMQSVEDDLSTYSGRLRNMKHFIEHSDRDTLVIIDEFGSGTDPKIGGAIAESMLRTLNFSKVYGVITTHYSNLKYYAFRTKGLVNGSMEFDKAKLAPSYQLMIGKPGSSFAFEIAEKTGLPEKMLSYAKHKAGKNEQTIDELLANLQSEKKELEQKLMTLMDKEDRLDRMIQSYSELHKELEFRRKKHKLEMKEQKLADSSIVHQKIEEAIKEIKKEKDLEAAKMQAVKLKEQRKDIAQDIHQLSDEIYTKNLGEIRDIKVGDYVKMRKGDARGEVLEIHKKNAVVQLGILKLTVPLHELELVNQPIKTFKKSVYVDTAQRGSQMETKLDIRGYKKSDAETAIQNFLDKALLSNLHEVTIIHGMGTGVLKKVVMRMMKDYNDIKGYRQPEDEHGGQGVTIIEF